VLVLVALQGLAALQAVLPLQPVLLQPVAPNPLQLVLLHPAVPLVPQVPLVHQVPLVPQVPLALVVFELPELQDLLAELTLRMALVFEPPALQELPVELPAEPLVLAALSSLEQPAHLAAALLLADLRACSEALALPGPEAVQVVQPEKVGQVPAAASVAAAYPAVLAMPASQERLFPQLLADLPAHHQL
jgi:hypothetical protein